MPEGSVTVDVQAPKYLPQSHQVQLSLSSPQQLQVELEEDNATPAWVWYTVGGVGLAAVAATTLGLIFATRSGQQRRGIGVKLDEC